MTDTQTANANNSHAGEHETLRDRATHAYESAKARAEDTVETSREALEGKPLGLLVGGLALGAAVGALIPRSDREKELLAPVGKRVNAAALAAIAAAKEAGQNELAELGLTKDGARGQVKTLFQGVAKAASQAGTAAAQAGREQMKSSQ